MVMREVQQGSVFNVSAIIATSQQPSLAEQEVLLRVRADCSLLKDQRVLSNIKY